MHFRNSDGEEAVVGFVTARVFRLWECDPADRLHLSLDDRLLDHELVFYILTLAVSPPFRYIAWLCVPIYKLIASKSPSREPA